MSFQPDIPEGIYSPGSIQVRGLDGTLSTNRAIVTSIIVPYQPRDIRIILDDNHWLISGTGDIGADIQLEDESGISVPEASTIVDPYGDFEIVVHADHINSQDSYFLIMSKNNLSSISTVEVVVLSSETERSLLCRNSQHFLL